VEGDGGRGAGNPLSCVQQGTGKGSPRLGVQQGAAVGTGGSHVRASNRFLLTGGIRYRFLLTGGIR